MTVIASSKTLEHQVVQPVCGFLNCSMVLTSLTSVLVPRPFQSGNEQIQCIVGARALAEMAAGNVSSPDIELWSAAPNSIHVM